MAGQKIFQAKLTLTHSGAMPDLLTNSLFDAAFRDSEQSAIDDFTQRIAELNKVVPAPSGLTPDHAQLFMLGVVAAVESYIRKIIRICVLNDEQCRASAHEEQISFAAALHLDGSLLPEALLEKYAFSSRKSIEDVLKEIVGYKGAFPEELQFSLERYSQVCQLRHCAVHRFGRLGSRNAVTLGIASHKELIEKPLSLDYANLQKIMQICACFVSVLNNFLFNEILRRVDVGLWTGAYRTDKKIFSKLYKIFADTLSMRASVPERDLYGQFMVSVQDWRAAENGKNS